MMTTGEINEVLQWIWGERNKIKANQKDARIINNRDKMMIKVQLIWDSLALS